MPLPVAVPIIGGVAVVGLVALRLRAMNKADGIGPKSLVGQPPNFATSPPAAAAVPANRSPANLPVLTQTQFNALDAERQRTIREDALKGVLTFTATNGALFTEKTAQPDTFVGVFKPGEDLQGLFIVVDVDLAKRFGTTIEGVTSGNVIFEPLEKNGATHVKAISRDPRLPGVTMSLPINAITGAGDP